MTVCSSSSIYMIDYIIDTVGTREIHLSDCIYYMRKAARIHHDTDTLIKTDTDRSN
jgi:hypothetical protein